jgi:hypothetical protein
MAGQLCYRLDTSWLPAATESGSGVRHSLMLLVDLNEERSSALTASEQQVLDPGHRLHGLDLSQVPAAGQAAVTVHTLSPSTGYGPGHYRMTVLKQTTGSDNFFKLTDRKKKCMVGPVETMPGRWSNGPDCRRS